jgi:hypothetical protein
MQVDGRVGFEAAVSAATGELRAGVAVERDAAAGLRRAVAVLRGEVAGLDSREATAAALAERDAARALAATRSAERDAARALAATQAAERDAARALAATRSAERDAARALAATQAAERDAARALAATQAAERDAARALAATRAAELAALQHVVSELQRDLAGAVAGREELRRRAEEDARHGPVVADAIARKVATPLTTPAASAYLRGRGFPAGSQPAGITWGIDTVPAGRLTASSVHHESHAAHPCCRLMYLPNAVAGKDWFGTGNSQAAGEWVCVDLGGERSVVGALVQGYEVDDICSEGEANSWFRHKFQWSADGATWTDVDGGRVWSREGLVHKDVSAAVFGAPVRCRYLRIVAVSKSGIVRWEVVVLP